MKGLAHGIKPLAYVGKNGLSPSVSRAIDESLATHELIKVKLVDFKEKVQKAEIADASEQRTASELVGMIMCDFCALNPAQRKGMLRKFHKILRPSGSVLLDVYSLSAFDQTEEAAAYEVNQFNGFWSPINFP